SGKIGPMHPPRLLALLAASSVLAAACGEVVEPEGFSTSTIVAAIDDGTGASSVELPLAGSDEPPVTLVAPNFVPQRQVGYIPDVLISTDTEILIAGVDGDAQSLGGAYADIASLRAVDDLLGGLVFQRPGEAGEVLWLSGEGAAAQVVADTVDLLDVGFSGSGFAVVQTDRQLEQIRLVDAERTALHLLADDEEVLALSASGGLHALAVADDDCGELRFFDLEGAPIELQGPGEALCPVPRRPYFATVALSPDGAAMSYTVVSYREDGLESGTELVVRDLASGRAYFRRKIGEDGDRITDLTFDGDRVAYVKTNAEAAAVNILEVAVGAQEQTIELDESVGRINSISFARLPLTEG
ncbi:MAG: hypothetical protein AAGK32_06015, partial [Actinomycetota bacterium]